jgi:hypothetical protein
MTKLIKNMVQTIPERTGKHITIRNIYEESGMHEISYYSDTMFKRVFHFIQLIRLVL